MIHVNRAGTSLGMFPEEDVREGLRSGRFAPNDLGWREGMAQWQPLSQFPEFAITAPSTPGGPPPIAPVVAVAPAETAAPRSGLPWDQREQRGIFNAFLETLMMVLTKPGLAFTAMRREGGLFEPLLYAVIGGSIGFVVHFAFTFALHAAGVAVDRDNALLGVFGMGIGLVLLVICIPVLVAIGVFISSAILHLCLMMVGGAKQSFETTFRVVSFAAGSAYPLMIVPLCGGMIAGIWALVAECIGLARAHETDTGRAVLAVLLPVIVCCGGGFFLAMMFGALGAWGLSQH
jgi:hypothetical protein